MKRRQATIATLSILTAAASFVGLTACGSEQADSAASNASASSSSSAGANELLAKYELQDKDATTIIDELDRLAVADRPSDLRASVRPDELQIANANNKEEFLSLPLPDNTTYISVAPYEFQTHDCFYHSLTTCKGELANTPIHVTFTDKDGNTLIDEDTTTFDNGFAGFWVPKETTGTITVESEGKTGTVDFDSTADGATCVTTLKLS